MTAPDTERLILSMNNTCARLNTHGIHTFPVKTRAKAQQRMAGGREYYLSCERQEKSQNTAKGTSQMVSPRGGRCASLCMGFHQHQWDTDGPGSRPTETLGNPSCAAPLPPLLDPQPGTSCPRLSLLTFCSANSAH